MIFAALFGPLDLSTVLCGLWLLRPQDSYLLWARLNAEIYDKYIDTRVFPSMDCSIRAYDVLEQSAEYQQLLDNRKV